VQLESGPAPDLLAQYRVADAGFFGALGIDLVRGRLFDERDVGGAPHAAVINTTLAGKLFGAEDPIGRRFYLGAMDPYRDDWLTVVGVVEEARPWSVPAGGYPVYYVDYRQRPAFLAFFGADFVVRAPGAEVASVVASRLAALDPDLPVRVSALESRLASRIADRRFVLALLAAFAGLSLALTAVGLWGVVSFVASRRMRDMGVRLALGATPSSVLRGLQWEAAAPVLAGMALGAVLAISLTRFVRSQLYGVGVFDPLSFTLVALLVAAAAWCASYLPARQVKHLDPAATLQDG
jgi:ABC-type antimicrobial peptide transport system permease subunit